MPTRPSAARLLATVVAVLAPALAVPAHAQSPDPLAARVDRVFAEYDRADSPGCAVGVVRDGRFAYQRGFGMANLDYDQPNGPDMVYYVGSVSKQFTAAAIALLALDGKLSLDDDVRKHVPELPDYGTPITIRHLVHHTSGIRDIYALMGMRGDRMEDVFPDSMALALIVRQKGLGFAPGTRYSYSNSGYFLLAQIVRRASGQSLREFADARIFAPLGMTRTHFHDDPGHPMKRRAMSYERDTRVAGGYRISYLQNFDKVGAGGLYSTLDDLRKWDANYYTHQVGGEALQRILHTRGVLASGDTLPYAFGNSVTRHRGLRVTEHGGALMGYKAFIGRYPDQQLTVLLACNLGAVDPERLAHAVAEVYLEDRMTPRAAVATAAPGRTPAPAPAVSVATPATAASAVATVSAADAALVGAYYSPDLDVTYRVVPHAGGGLALAAPGRAPVPLVATAAGAYRSGGTVVRFERGTGRAPATLVLQVSRIGEMRLLPVRPSPP